MKAEKGCVIGCLGMIVGMGVIVVGLMVCVIIGASAMDLRSEGDDTFGTVRSEREKTGKKIWVCGEGDEDDPKILRVKIGGIISDRQEDLFGRERASALSALKKIRAATHDEEIQGLYLILDTPGGEVTLADIIADAVRRFKEAQEDRFVLVEMGSLCCSGGYYIAAGADYIMAHPTTITGSIGVLLSTINAAELAKKIGIESVVIATGTNKAMLDPLKPVDQEHVKIFKKAVDADYERFLSIVSKGRKIPVEKLRPIADGRILNAEEAKELKLIDAIGYAEDAEAQLAKLANSEDIRIIRYKDEHTLRDLFEDTFLSSQGMGRALRNAATSARHTTLSFIAE